MYRVPISSLGPNIYYVTPFISHERGASVIILSDGQPLPSVCKSFGHLVNPFLLLLLPIYSLPGVVLTVLLLPFCSIYMRLAYIAHTLYHIER